MQRSIPGVHKLEARIYKVVVACWQLLFVVIESLFPFELAVLLGAWSWRALLSSRVLSIVVESSHDLAEFLEVQREDVQMQNYLERLESTCFDVAERSIFEFSGHADRPLRLCKVFINFRLRLALV